MGTPARSLYCSPFPFIPTHAFVLSLKALFFTDGIITLFHAGDSIKTKLAAV